MPVAPENGEQGNGSNRLAPASLLMPPALPARPMLEPPPNPELLSSLGRLVRGLSALFWGLPLALVVCVQSAKGDWFERLNVVPALAATGLLFYGLTLLGHFQKQERVWQVSLERSKVFSLINVGLSPFLYWWNRMPLNAFYSSVVALMMLSGLLFLLALNPVLWRLVAMLPDENLRLETRLFTAINRYLLLLTVVLLAAYLVVLRIDQLPHFLLNLGVAWDNSAAARFNQVPDFLLHLSILLKNTGLWLVLFLVLVPVAMTMALLWKIKEVILAGVFGPEH